MFNYIDNFLFDGFFEPFSRFIQKWIGWTCFSLSRICIFTYVFITSVYAVGEKEQIWIFIDMSMLGVFSILSFLCSLIAETQCFGGLAKGFRNPARPSMLGIRKDILEIVVILMVYNFFDQSIYLQPIYSLNIGNIVAHYFMACTPLPPGKSKVRKAWEKLKEFGSLVPTPA